jgi:23S rRNA (cytosine1962-C5)-methyltransferase
VPAASAVPKIAINARAAKRLRAGHPWVYRSDLATNTNGQTPRAALVHVTDERGKFLATALSSSSSQIALRVIANEPLDEPAIPGLIRSRVIAAAKYRERFVHNSDGYRVAFSEADQLPGLIIDRYGDVFILQVLTQAMDRDDLRSAVLEGLHIAYGAELDVVERVEERIRELEDLPVLPASQVEGGKSATVFAMNGLRFHFDALTGQKTGAFLDQRENYAAAAKYAHGEALDVFSYQGGFALHLARVCSSVTGVDISRAALETAEQNALLNTDQLRCGEIEWLEADAFDLLKDYSHPKLGRKFDTIVLDPPAFAKSKRALETALRGYKEINLRALKMLRPGGILVTNSCSHHVNPSEFLSMLAEAAADARRNVRILANRSQSPDHPIVLGIPETHYLKNLICWVE